MRELVFEILLRFIKPGFALVLGVVVYVVAVGLGASPGAELAILAWLAGSAFVLMVESGPI